MGRPKGSLNKKTVETVRAIESSGMTPLDYMLGVMRDPNADVARRDFFAVKAAPFVHGQVTNTPVSPLALPAPDPKTLVTNADGEYYDPDLPDFSRN